jgi:sec-independent protein translocase protein TatA
MAGVSPVQIVIVLAIVLLVFGPARLPEIARGVGRSVRELKGSLAGDAPRPRAGGGEAPPD